MKLFGSRSSARPRLSPEVAETVQRLALEIDAALVVARSLLETRAARPLDERERSEALMLARRLSGESRVCFMLIDRLFEELPDEYSHVPALRVARRLAFCLLALSGDDPEELALLGPDEVDGLLGENGAEDWMELVLRTARGGAR